MTEVIALKQEKELGLMVAADTSLFFDIARFEHAQRVAKALSTATIVPDHFRNNIGNILIALNTAERMRTDPVMLMQNMYIIHGKPGIEGKLAIALINQSGKFTPLQFRLEGEGDARQCTAYATHKETGETLEQTVTWKMVEAEGWNKDKKTKSGGIQKSKWNTLPDLMFQYRSGTFFARVYCPEVLLGMRTKDELDDMAMSLVKQPNGSYAAPETEALTDKIHADAQEGAAEALYGPKGSDDTQQGPPASIEALMESLVGLPYATYWKLRTKGLTNVIKACGNKMVDWPNKARDNLREKYQNVFGEALTLGKIQEITGITPEPDPAPAQEQEPTEQTGSVLNDAAQTPNNSGSGEPATIVCNDRGGDSIDINWCKTKCTKRDNCNAWQEAEVPEGDRCTQ